MRRGELLFNKYPLDGVMAQVEAKMYSAIEALPEKQILGTNPEELATFFAEEYRLDLPQLHEDRIAVDRVESRRDVSRHPDRYISGRSRPFYVPATEYKYFVPFDGEGQFFLCQGNQLSFNPPRAQVDNQELVFTFLREDDNAAEVKAEFDRQFSQVKEFLSGIVALGEEFNRSLQGKALGRINARRERLAKSVEAVSALGYPMRRRPDAAKTYAVPEVKRRMTPVMPKASEPKPLEPTLPDAEYEHILAVITNMVAVMERSPAAFHTMREEDLRQHFLVQLNGQYEGQATGETFNFEGKTDILIRAGGKNIFIAECKFWDGPRVFNEAIDQLLGYTTWHDTKTALLVFNRDRGLSGVLAKIPELVRARSDCVRGVEQAGATRFRFTLRRPDDPEREVTLTVLVFEIPVG